MSKTAVIIKGNPALITNNPRADAFYEDLEKVLILAGYDVRFNAGEPYTSPDSADLWIGHSRGADRLQFAPEGTLVIGVGVPLSTGETTFPIVNNPEDKMSQRIFSEGKIVEGEPLETLDDDNHYILTEGMKKQILDLIKNFQDKDM
jgi:hypothetical protein